MKDAKKLISDGKDPGEIKEEPRNAETVSTEAGSCLWQCNDLTEARKVMQEYLTCRDRLRAVKEQLAQQDGTPAVNAALAAIANGVSEGAHGPLLPSLLRECLSDTCPHCKQTTITWKGSLPWLEAKLAPAERTVATLPPRLSRSKRGQQLSKNEGRLMTIGPLVAVAGFYWPCCGFTSPMA